MKIICAEECAAETKTSGGEGWTLASGVLFLFMPKCAFCWAAYMSLFSSIGLAVHYRPWFLPMALLLFLATLLKLLIRAIRTRNYISFLLALLAAAGMFWRQGIPGIDTIKITAVVLMTLAITGRKWLLLCRFVLKRCGF